MFEYLVPLNLWAILVVVSPIAAFMTFHTQVTLAYGRAIASKDSLDLNPRGLQDSLTNPKYNWLFFFIHLLRILIVIGLFYIGGALHGVSSIVVIFIISYVLQKKIFPAPHNKYWAFGLVRSLANREANYRRDGDLMRADAIKDITADLMAYVRAMKD